MSLHQIKMIPQKLLTHIREQTGETIASAMGVSGGSINQAAKVELSSHGICFLKWNDHANPDMFFCEVKGLTRLQNAGTGLVIPDIIDYGKTVDDVGYLLLDFIEQGSGDRESAESFGAELAALHNEQAERYGLDHDNYIGRLPQSNTWRDSWTDFFIDERLEPQVRMGVDSGKFNTAVIKSFKSLYKRLPEIFPDEPPSLLHGDLWGGNYYFNKSGKATVYDPAVYYGNREIELAFTYLFGGFSTDFYTSYQANYPLNPGFENRIEVYNLYPLLVHTNLFGGHYGRQVRSIVQRYD